MTDDMTVEKNTPEAPQPNGNEVLVAYRKAREARNAGSTLTSGVEKPVNPTLERLKKSKLVAPAIKPALGKYKF